MEPIRELWTRMETCHAVTYFADESRAAASRAGLRGFWMGYFGFRAAPLGSVAAVTVEEAFFNFAPSMVQRSIPDAWAFATPASLIDARRSAAAECLTRVAPALDAGALLRINDILRDVASIDDGSLPMFAANRQVELTGEPVSDLWQHCTTLREHRGDIHVNALRNADLDGCQAHILFAADHRLPPDILQPNRGWTDTEWAARQARLIARGLLRDDGALTLDGHELRLQIERETDEGAAVPFRATGNDAFIVELIEALDPIARTVAASGTIPYPNPMGLPPLTPGLRVRGGGCGRG